MSKLEEFVKKHDREWKHKHCCEHNNVAYCKVCKVVYCKDCGREWQDNPWTFPYPVNPTYKTYPGWSYTPSVTSSGSVQINNTTTDVNLYRHNHSEAL